MKFITRALFGFYLVIAPIVLPANENTERRWIMVTGEGIVETPPDLAVLRFGVMTTSKSAKAATRANNGSIAKIISALKEEGISSEDLETTRFSLSPQREYRKNQPPMVIGYQVSNTLMVKVRDLDRVGEYMELIVESGGNNFESLSFTVEDTHEMEEEARVLAIENALSKAEMMTGALDSKVGLPLTIQEISHSNRLVQQRRMMEADVMMASEVPIQAPSELNIRVRVQVKFEIE